MSVRGLNALDRLMTPRDPMPDKAMTDKAMPDKAMTDKAMTASEVLYPL